MAGSGSAEPFEDQSAPALNPRPSTGNSPSRRTQRLTCTASVTSPAVDDAPGLCQVLIRNSNLLLPRQVGVSVVLGIAGLPDGDDVVGRHGSRQQYVGVPFLEPEQSADEHVG